MLLVRVVVAKDETKNKNFFHYKLNYRTCFSCRCFKIKFQYLIEGNENYQIMLLVLLEGVVVAEDETQNKNFLK